jgi:heat shock protein HslJ
MDERPIQLLDRLAPEVDVAAARRVFETRARVERRRRRWVSGCGAMAALLLVFVGVRAAVTRDSGHVLVRSPADAVKPDGRWKLVSGIEGADTAKITLVIDGSKIGGTGGCNGYGGEVALGTEGQWMSDGVYRNEMACDRLASEETYWAAFDRVRSFAVEDNGTTLMLKGLGVELRYERDSTPLPPASPAAPSVDGSWQLDTFNGPLDQSIASSPVFLAITANTSSITGFAGCVELEGAVVAQKTATDEGLAIGYLQPNAAKFEGQTCADISWLPKLSGVFLRVTPDDVLELVTNEFSMRFKRETSGLRTSLTSVAGYPLPKVDGRWELVSATDLADIDPASVHLTIDGSRITGNIACDEFTGTVSFGEGGFMAVTELNLVKSTNRVSLCPTYEVTAKIAAGLRQAKFYQLDGGTLSLRSDSATYRFSWAAR